MAEGNEIFKEQELLKLRHSTSHIMAQAVLEMFPGAKLAIGPAIKDGFYYDFDLPRTLIPEDLNEIEKRMQKIVKGNFPFKKQLVTREEAINFFKERQQTYKLELIEDIPENEAISFYTHSDFTDLCSGPHLEYTSKCKHHKLYAIAGAYWRGDEKNAMLQRIYGTAFPTKDELEAFLRKKEEAKKRDHRKLGKELDLFSFHPEAPASPFFHPKGAFIYNQLIAFARAMYDKYDYSEVITPQILDVSLWHQSGHYENYRENMYFTSVDDRESAVKPMNCPTHALIYQTQTRSYRDLPVRYADFGRIHRYEKSGATGGLTRVRTFSQDDAHIFCTPDQIMPEISDLLKMIMEYYATFGFSDIRISLATRPEKSIGSDEIWQRAEASLEQALKDNGVAYRLNAGDGAFYGPKVDFYVIDALEREWQLGTIQLDFSMPSRFNLAYISPAGEKETPVMIHRAILGSIERFMGILIEHCGGAFPTWLAPVQGIVLPIAERHHDYAQAVVTALKKAKVRVEFDSRNEKLQLKIREAELQKIPYMIIVGDKEQETESASVRSYFEGQLGSLAVSDLASRIAKEVGERTMFTKKMDEK